MVTGHSAKSAIKYSCEICNIVCSKKNDYDRHLLTAKHIGNETGNKKSAKTIFLCDICNKEYKSRKGLWGHSKVCKKIDENINLTVTEKILDASANEIKALTSLVMELVKSNTELQKQMIEVCKNNQPTNITNTNSHNTTNNNKTFNLQFFLNEQCKDAMNLQDFVNSFQLNLEDLERVGQHGYVDGIAHIIIEKIRGTDLHKRPFHCSDAKRETLYVKDDNVWEKEGAESLKMIKAVKDVGQKNFNVLNDYRTLHPECLQSESEYNDKYIKLMIQAVGSQKENVAKVIKKIAKEVVIEKGSE